MLKCPCGREFQNHASMGVHAHRCELCTPDVRFWLKVEKGDGCWRWTGALQRDGYAHCSMHRKTVSAHRYAYEQLVGPIPAGMDLLHSCDNRWCVNPAHLRPGTHDENMAEARARGKYRLKISDEQIATLRADAESMSVKAVAAKYGVTSAWARRVVKRERRT